ncbi:DNA-binding transcriptional regulator, FadR family [Raineyella antarctica]|uniref:DNA-binding transcriptional regulator, FadR family n=1 Tax=Raineyella antarctica TaxID=1577474 RepID=A0A1G6GX75_9ACTN|nr:FCD domain-containing protein [Raineyella antarctica]SDB86534.1 DNA-binding transcriptional regulator, FadR family [Raineyella antarctica]
MADGTKAYQVVLEHIEEAILGGTLLVGQLLPPERDLAAQLGVSRAAVREAIHALVAQGVLTSSVGPRGGTRVAAMQAEALKRVLRLQVALADFPVSDVSEVRIALERTTIAAACRDIAPEVLAQIREVLDLMSAAEDPDEFNALDTRFHVLIATAGHNELATDMTIAIRESLRRPILGAEKVMDGWPAFRGSAMDQHERIYAALAAGDAQEAAAAMEAHIRASYSILPLETS